jgi:hypothetical protein
MDLKERQNRIQTPNQIGQTTKRWVKIGLERLEIFSVNSLNHKTSFIRKKRVI